MIPVVGACWTEGRCLGTTARVKRQRECVSASESTEYKSAMVEGEERVRKIYARVVVVCAHD